MNRHNSSIDGVRATTLPGARWTSTKQRQWVGAIIWLLTFSLGTALTQPAQAAIPAAQRTVLITLYDNTNGSNWIDHDGWLGAPGTECSWYGIACDEAQTHVVSVDLEANNLVGGPIPSLTGLPDIEAFDVGENRLSGSLPTLAGLVNLRYFDASSNQLSGSIPLLTDLPGLQTFYVNDNRLTGAIPALANLSRLANFQASFNQLSGTIPPLTGLTQLAFFHVYNNQLTGMIPSLTGLIHLTSFDVGNNQLRGSTVPLTGLTNLQAFAIDANQFSGEIPVVPEPDNLLEGQSLLCPNQVNLTPSTDWDHATSATPWYTACDLIFADGFKEPLHGSAQAPPVACVRKTRRFGEVRLVACRAGATQDCERTQRAQPSDFE